MGKRLKIICFYSRQLCDFSTLKVVVNSLIDEQLTQYATDVLYSLNIDNTTGFIYCLVEAQSQPQELMAFRLWHYSSMVLKKFLEEQKNKPTKLPVVVPILFYTGTRSPYPHSLDLMDCFEDKVSLRQLCVTHQT